MKVGTGHLMENNMPRKTKIIFITVFVLVGVIVLGFYFYSNKTKTDGTNTAVTDYLPFLGGSTTDGQGSNNGGTNTDSTIPTTPLTPTDEPFTTGEVSRFTQITDYPVAGAVFFEDTRPLPISEVSTALPGGEKPPEIKTPLKNTKTSVKPAVPKFEIVPSIRYVERITGHINQMYLDTKVVGKVSNGTIPTIHEALFDSSASSVLYRYLGTDGNTINSFLATLGSTQGEFLPANILDVSISPDKTKFFYLTETQNGVVGTTRSFKDTKKTQVFISSLTEWLSQWVTNQNIYLTTKASYSVDGDLFSLNTSNSVLTKVFGGVKGLTTLANKDGSLVLYSSSIFGGPRLGVFDVKKHTTKEFNLYSLPEKCVWSPDAINVYCAIPSDTSGGEYPDSWYQGRVSFNDHFVKINTVANEINTLADSTYGTPVDATHMFLNKAEDQLFFINKKDSTLWSLSLN